MKEMKEMLVQSQAQEDPLEEEMVTHSVFLPENFHGQRSLAGYSPRGLKESDMTEHTYVHSHKHTCTQTSDEHAIMNEKHFLTGTLHSGFKVQEHHHPEMHQHHCR